MKKFLALVLVILSTIALMAFPSLADEAATEIPTAADVLAPEGDSPVIGDADAPATEGAQIANPWVESTEADAYAKLGASFAFAAPEGFTFDNIAYLGAPDALDTSSVRLVYMNGEQMLRIHITNTAIEPSAQDAAEGDAATDETVETPIEANGITGEYDANANAISYLVDSFEIEIDAPGYTQEQLTALVGSVTLADAPTDAAPTDAPANAEATETPAEDVTAE